MGTEFEAYNFEDPIYKGVISSWMRWNASFHDYYLTFYHWKNFHYLKTEFEKHTTLGFPFKRRHPPHKSIKFLYLTITTVWQYPLHDHFYNFGVPIYQGVLLMKKWNISFHDAYCVTIHLWNLSLLENSF